MKHANQRAEVCQFDSVSLMSKVAVSAVHRATFADPAPSCWMLKHPDAQQTTH